MPTCQSCTREWTWKEAFKKQFNLMGMMHCPYCKAKQYYSKSVRKLGGVIPFIIIMLIMLANILFGPSIIAFFALIAILPIYLLVFPFFMRLSNEEAPFN